MKFANLLVPVSHSFIFYIVQSTVNWATQERWFWEQWKEAVTLELPDLSSVV